MSPEVPTNTEIPLTGNTLVLGNSDEGLPAIASRVFGAGGGVMPLFNHGLFSTGHGLELYVFMITT